jgi:hypothetical protein
MTDDEVTVPVAKTPEIESVAAGLEGESELLLQPIQNEVDKARPMSPNFM